MSDQVVVSALAVTTEHLSSSGSEIAGLNVKYVYGLLLLLLAALLVAGQLYQLVHPATAAPNAQAKEKLKTAADRVVEAADKTKQAAATMTSARYLTELRPEDAGYEIAAAPGSPHRELLSKLAAEEKQVEDEADDAKKAADDAKQEVEKSATLTDVVNTVAGKLPLVGGAIILALLGAWVSDFIKITFS